MKSCLKIFSGIIIVMMAIVFSGCATVLKLDYNPAPNPDNLLSSAAPVKIKILDFEDKREDKATSELIGGVKRAYVAPIDDVLSDRPVTELIREAVRTELTRNGHSVVDSGEDFTVSGEVKTFWLHTDITADEPEEWDVICEIKLVLELGTPDSGHSKFVGPYAGKNIESRFMQPDATVFKRVVEAALSDMFKKMSSDANLVNILGKR